MSALLASSACASRQQPAPQGPLQALSNDQVEWDGNPAGFVALLRGDAPREVLEQGEAAVPALLDMLDDPRRFVVAHVLLTKLTHVRYRAFPEWNGLTIELQGRQPAVIAPEQRFTLARRWRRWAEMSPRPEMLPSVD